MNTAGDFMARLDDFLRREQDDAWSYDVLRDNVTGNLMITLNIWDLQSPRRDTAVEGLNELWTHLNEMGHEDELESSINKIAQFLQTDVESVGYGRFYHKPEEK
tara:strand:- start:683 stop:994 length:312 start_codon:yes stop_codon:yes gene_type:complete